jgi:hypothetical protein
MALTTARAFRLDMSLRDNTGSAELLTVRSRWAPPRFPELDGGLAVARESRRAARQESLERRLSCRIWLNGFVAVS